MTRTSGRRIRVLHVVQNLNYGGQERIIAEIVRGVDLERFEPHVLGLKYLGHFSEGLGKVAELHVGTKMSRLAMVRPKALAAQIRTLAPDVVHSHGGVWMKVARAARMAGVPRMIQTEHGRAFPIGIEDRIKDAIALRNTDAVVVVSEKLGHELARTNRRFIPITSVVENGVDTSARRPIADSGVIRGELGLAPDVPIIGSVGRLVQVKGYDVAVEALRLLRRDWSGPGPAPVLVVAGDGVEMPRLREQIATAGLEDAAHLLSWRDDIENIHSGATIFTMTSRSEGTSVSLLEAMSAGLCPVVTHVGGNAAVLGRELAHRLVASEDAPAIAAAWHAALTDDASRIDDARTAREQIVERFSLASMLRAYERIYVEGASSASPDAGT